MCHCPSPVQDSQSQGAAGMGSEAMLLLQKQQHPGPRAGNTSPDLHLILMEKPNGPGCSADGDPVLQ